MLCCTVRKNIKICVSIFSTTSIWNVSHSKKKKEQDMIQMFTHVKYPFFLLGFNENCTVSTNFRKILKYQMSWKFVQWKPNCSVRKSRRTGMAKLRVPFRNFSKAPKNGLFLLLLCCQAPDEQSNDHQAARRIWLRLSQ